MSDGDSCQSIGEVIFTDKPGLYFVIFAFVVRFPLEGEVRRIAGDVSVDVQPVLTAVGNLVESVGYLFLRLADSGRASLLSAVNSRCIIRFWRKYFLNK